MDANSGNITDNIMPADNAMSQSQLHLSHGNGEPKQKSNQQIVEEGVNNQLVMWELKKGNIDGVSQPESTLIDRLEDKALMDKSYNDLCAKSSQTKIESNFYLEQSNKLLSTTLNEIGQQEFSDLLDNIRVAKQNLEQLSPKIDLIKEFNDKAMGCYSEMHKTLKIIEGQAKNVLDKQGIFATQHHKNILQSTCMYIAETCVKFGQEVAIDNNGITSFDQSTPSQIISKIEQGLKYILETRLTVELSIRLMADYNSTMQETYSYSIASLQGMESNIQNLNDIMRGNTSEEQHALSSEELQKNLHNSSSILSEEIKDTITDLYAKIDVLNSDVRKIKELTKETVPDIRRLNNELQDLQVNYEATKQEVTEFILDLEEKMKTHIGSIGQIEIALEELKDAVKTNMISTEEIDFNQFSSTNSHENKNINKEDLEKQLLEQSSDLEQYLQSDNMKTESEHNVEEHTDTSELSTNEGVIEQHSNDLNNEEDQTHDLNNEEDQTHDLEIQTDSDEDAEDISTGESQDSEFSETMATLEEIGADNDAVDMEGSLESVEGDASLEEQDIQNKSLNTEEENAMEEDQIEDEAQEEEIAEEIEDEAQEEEIAEEIEDEAQEEEIEDEIEDEAQEEEIEDEVQKEAREELEELEEMEKTGSHLLGEPMKGEEVYDDNNEEEDKEIDEEEEQHGSIEKETKSMIDKGFRQAYRMKDGGSILTDTEKQMKILAAVEVALKSVIGMYTMESMGNLNYTKNLVIKLTSKVITSKRKKFSLTKKKVTEFMQIVEGFIAMLLKDAVVEDEQVKNMKTLDDILGEDDEKADSEQTSADADDSSAAKAADDLSQKIKDALK